MEKRERDDKKRSKAKRKRLGDGECHDTQESPTSARMAAAFEEVDLATSPEQRALHAAKGGMALGSGAAGKKPQFVHGNYANYYKLRHAGLSKDDRIPLIPAAIVTGKKVLDIGCNSGIFAIQLFNKYKPELIRGIDIDRKLVERARKNSRASQRSACMENEYAEALEALGHPSFLPLSFKLLLQYHTKTEQCRMFFDASDYVASESVPEAQYDTVMCLSTVKWIHLNGGDAAVKRLFHKVYKTLVPGGSFLLEPQPWSSYRKKRLLTPEITINFKAIELKPVDFEHYLIHEVRKQVGFATCEHLGGVHRTDGFASGKSTGRALLLFKK